MGEHDARLDSYLPLTPAMFHVLIVLAEGPKHGYRILKEVERRTDSRVRLSTGTLYGIIKRLLAEGMIERRTPAVAGADKRRRYYQLTELGQAVATAEAERLQRVVKLAWDSRLLRDPS